MCNKLKNNKEIFLVISIMLFSWILSLIFESDALIGVIGGGLSTLLGGYIANKNNKKLQEEKDLQLLNDTISALQSELDCSNNYVNEILKDKRFVQNPRSVEFNYLDLSGNLGTSNFAIYDLNANIIGQIKDEKFRSSIIKVYSNMKFLFNNVNAYIHVLQNIKSDVDINRNGKSLNDSSILIIKLYDEFNILYDEAIKQIKTYLKIQCKST